MANLESLFSPGDPKDVALRPLSKGMVRNIPPNRLDPGAFLVVGNYIAGQEGLRRRPAVQLQNAAGVLYPPVRDVIPFWRTDGSQQTLVIDTRFLYTMTPTALTPVYYAYSSPGTCRVSGLFMIGASNPNWTSTTADIKNGDVAAIYSGAILLATYDIAAVTATNQMTLVSGGTIAAGKTSQIRHAFKINNPYTVDWTNIGGKIVFCDSSRRMTHYDGLNYSRFGSASYASTCTFVPTTVCFHRDRLYAARLTGTGFDYRQRITWSTTVNKDNFGTTQWLDLPYVSGYAIKLLPLGQLLVAYFTDSVWIGRPTNIGGNTLPFMFERLDTGGIGLVGTHGVCAWFDGHFFIGDDDIYYLSTQLELRRIGTPIAKDYLRSYSNKWNAFACPDPLNNRVLFAIPDSDETFSKILSFDVLAQAWSYDAVSGSCIARLLTGSGITYDTIISTSPYHYDGTFPAGLSIYPTIDSIGGRGEAKTFIGQGSHVMFLSSTASTDYPSSSISCLIETGDIDFDTPSQDKTWLEFGLKIDRILTDQLDFKVYISHDRGNNWKDLTNELVGKRHLLIDAGTDENRINFRSTGSIARFRVTSSSVASEYVINEITMYIAPRGRELQFASNE